jgi:hypothetical protein
MTEHNGEQKQMEAICKPDYDLRVQINIQAEKEKVRLKKKFDDEVRLRRNPEVKSISSKKKTNGQKDNSEGEDKPDQEFIVPIIGYYDIYGVWFFGQLKEIVREIAKNRFQMELNKMMHVFVDVEPKKLSDGIHDIRAYGHACRLYKWTAQGYHRGLVVLTDDETGNQMARIYMESGTWSWMLGDEDKRRIEEILPH